MLDVRLPLAVSQELASAVQGQGIKLAMSLDVLFLLQAAPGRTLHAGGRNTILKAQITLGALIALVQRRQVADVQELVRDYLNTMPGGPPKTEKEEHE